MASARELVVALARLLLRALPMTQRSLTTFCLAVVALLLGCKSNPQADAGAKATVK